MENINRVNWIKYLFITKYLYARRFKKIGKGSVIFAPMQFSDVRSVVIGRYAVIAHGAWLMGNSKNNITLKIGNGVHIGHFAHIIAKHSVTIEDNVLIADKVYITDCGHNYEDIVQPVLRQGVYHIGKVRIAEGSWLGENVCVLGAKIGRHCIIGANAVVTKDIPDYSVAVGIPAKVVKRYSFESGRWERVYGKNT